TNSTFHHSYGKSRTARAGGSEIPPQLRPLNITWSLLLFFPLSRYASFPLSRYTDGICREGAGCRVITRNRPHANLLIHRLPSVIISLKLNQRIPHVHRVGSPLDNCSPNSLQQPLHLPQNLPRPRILRQILKLVRIALIIVKLRAFFPTIPLRIAISLRPHRPPQNPLMPQRRISRPIPRRIRLGKQRPQTRPLQSRYATQSNQIHHRRINIQKLHRPRACASANPRPTNN